MPGAFGLHDVITRELPHARLECVDLGQHRECVERTNQLHQVPGNECVDDGLAGLRCLLETREMVRDHLLLQQHRAVLQGFSHQVAPQSLIESANVPACSRNCWNWPVFSAYLNAMQGIPACSAPVRSIGWSSSAGSQKLGVAKMIPSAWAAPTRPDMRCFLPCGSPS